MRHTTSLGHTKEEQYPTVDLIAAIKNATYSTSTGDANSSRESSRNSGGRGDGSMCRIPGATAPRVRYFYPSEHLVHNSSLSSGRVSAEDRDQLLLFKEVSYGDLAALMSVAVSNEDVPELSPSFMARTQQLDEFWRYVEADNYVSPSGRRDSVSLNRKLFDSR